MIKAVFFDLDGTLLDGDQSLQHFIEGQYQRYREALHHIDIGESISRLLEFDEHGYTPKDLVYQRMEADFHVKHIDWQDLLQDYRNQSITAVYRLQEWKKRWSI
ncbi:HAD family hydrolase [Bacillus testis]|uniref:HAD family hydrolase n=1 Tax=Bacillus testis TaxID=1622072 RepID=UPI00067EBC52|nr:HAD family hydrolase [Bacillus testis]